MLVGGEACTSVTLQHASPTRLRCLRQIFVDGRPRTDSVDTITDSTISLADTLRRQAYRQAGTTPAGTDTVHIEDRRDSQGVSCLFTPIPALPGHGLLWTQRAHLHRLRLKQVFTRFQEIELLIHFEWVCTPVGTFKKHAQ